MNETLSKIIAFIIIMAIIITVIAIISNVLANWVIYGQDVDPRYYCIYENTYPYSELCNDQRINDLMSQLLETAKRFDEKAR